MKHLKLMKEIAWNSITMWLTNVWRELQRRCLKNVIAFDVKILCYCFVEVYSLQNHFFLPAFLWTVFVLYFWRWSSCLSIVCVVGCHCSKRLWWCKGVPVETWNMWHPQRIFYLFVHGFFIIFAIFFCFQAEWIYSHGVYTALSGDIEQILRKRGKTY